MLYIGPEIMMPVVSALAAIGGVILMFWRRLRAAARGVFRMFTGREAPAVRASDTDAPAGPANP